MRKYPHLLPADAALWDQFITANQSFASSLEYDIHVGQGRDPGDQFDPTIRNTAILLSQRRIDVVATHPAHIDIIEVSTTAGLTQVGQLMTYPLLYQQTYSPTLPLRPLLICRQFQTDAQPAFNEHQIPYIIVPFPT
jgi:hypothetical protein